MFLSHTYILALRFAFGFVLGAVFGSFGTMLAYRLPRGLSIVRPRSHCTSCGTTLKPLDMVPIFSWLAFRGRCRHCGTAIGARYVAIELAVSIACAIATVLVGFSPWLVLAYAVILAMTVAAAIKLQMKDS